MGLPEMKSIDSDIQIYELPPGSYESLDSNNVVSSFITVTNDDI